MSRFKVGDRVRVISEDFELLFGAPLEFGDTGTVQAINARGSIRVSFERGLFWVTPGAIETDNPVGTFKVGQTVGIRAGMHLGITYSADACGVIVAPSFTDDNIYLVKTRQSDERPGEDMEFYVPARALYHVPSENIRDAALAMLTRDQLMALAKDKLEI
jgi:hypothetical protein